MQKFTPAQFTGQTLINLTLQKPSLSLHNVKDALEKLAKLTNSFHPL